jgi:hypothetical protein
LTASSSSALRIGIDFDNTIAGYDAPFCVVARELGLVPAGFVGTKQAVRSAVRLLDDGERHWQRLQGQVYGARMDGATLFDGVITFLETCRRRSDTEVFIISHKTQYGHFDEAQVDLRAAARRWLTLQGFFDLARCGLTPDRVFFETTRAEKIARIGAVACTHFIDDLEEVLDDPAFPADVSRILFTNGQQPTPGRPYQVCGSWAEIAESILGTRR